MRRALRPDPLLVDFVVHALVLVLTVAAVLLLARCLAACGSVVADDWPPEDTTPDAGSDTSPDDFSPGETPETPDAVPDLSDGPEDPAETAPDDALEPDGGPDEAGSDEDAPPDACEAPEGSGVDCSWCGCSDTPAPPPDCVVSYLVYLRGGYTYYLDSCGQDTTALLRDPVNLDDGLCSILRAEPCPDGLPGSITRCTTSGFGFMEVCVQYTGPGPVDWCYALTNGPCDEED
jgi:hypothetical protein